MGVADLPDDLQAKLLKWDANKPENRSVRALEDIASMTQAVLDVLSEKPDDTAAKEMGVILVDMRESLAAIKSKESPEMPDYSKPLLAGLQKLEKAFTDALGKVRPEFKPNIQVESPNVTVEPSVVDLKGVEKVLKQDIPRAFKEAVALIPVTPAVKLMPLEELLKQMSEQLQSIDTATRMKPQSPAVLKVTNPDGSPIGMGRLVTERFDSVVASYPTTSTEVYSYSYQNATVAEVTVTYSDSTKETLTSAERTD